MKTVGFCTLGCKVNTYESAYLEEQFLKAGYLVQDFHEPCDIYVINTCTVTNESDKKSRKMIRFCRKLNKKAIIIAMGCFVEAHPDFLEDVDIRIGNTGKSRVLTLLDTYLKEKRQILLPIEKEKSVFEDMFLTAFQGRTRAFVKIQDGCENFCTYCIIPHVRGKCRSKDFNTVLREVTSLVAHGYQEVVLTGIHTGHYGVDISHSFAELLEAICQIKGLKRLRISSIEITELSDAFLKVLQENPIIVDHLHIPLQAGSDAVLKRMGRKYDLAYFEATLKKIRAIRKEIAITTDVIVGFPGESDADFLTTLDTVRRFAFMKIHVFPFSSRKGTPAERYLDQVADPVKKMRVRQLLSLSDELERDYLSTFLGREVAVLIEKSKDALSYGHTSNYMKVVIKANLKENKIYKVFLQKVMEDKTLEGVCVEEKCEV